VRIEEREDLQVELTVRPTWSILPAVRTFVEQSLGPVLRDPDLAYRLSMATHELLENAVKYSSKPSAILRVSAGKGPGDTAITVTNETTEEHLAGLRQQFAEMSGAADPIGYYCELMRRYSRQHNVSRLGLARIQAEGEMLLSLTAEAGVDHPGRAPVPRRGDPPVTELCKAIDNGAFAATGTAEGGLATVVMRGQADARIKAELDGFLGLAAREASRLGIAEVRVDLSKVEFMNSSCIKAFVNWIGQVQGLPPEKRYRIQFISDPTAQWQRRTLHALSVFGGELVGISS
jgi:anti-sigma regulatory factor (Ser/Thr protein kinase)